MACLVLLPWRPAAAVAAPPREIDRAAYADRLRAMWLAEAMANWTGIRTEGRRAAPPFHTDADWGTNPYPDAAHINLSFALANDPWWGDDDTDVEYVYLHLLTRHSATRLTAEQIRDGWMTHINHDIWVSNAAARDAMTLGLRPPATGFAQANLPPSYADLSVMIDAQLTTEFFGALAPGMPEVALELADLPIRTTATGHAAHAAQFFVALYALATQVDRSLPPGEQAVWLVRQARKFIPGTSKAADIADFVLADYLANPDKDDWECTRDAVYARYQLNAAANGFVYRGWYESSVNFAAGLIALLYGEMDLPRTVRIGTLSGWDSDNGTATMGGLLGLVLGMDGVLDAFVEWRPPNLPPSDRFRASRTRDNLPDHLPDDPGADDTFTLMAARCLPIIDRVVAESGGRVGADSWLLPPGGAGDGLTPEAALALSPTHRLTASSANIQLPLVGGTVWPSINIPGSPPSGYGSWTPAVICTGGIYDFRGLEPAPGSKHYTSTRRTTPTPEIHAFTVNYSQPVAVQSVRFVEGNHFHAPADAVSGGWFESITVEVYAGGSWIAPQVSASEPLDAAIPFQTIDHLLTTPVWATAIRVSGRAGGEPGQTFATCSALDALGPVEVSPRRTFDLNGDGRSDTEDLYHWMNSGGDLNLDGIVDSADFSHVMRAIRWTEPAMMSNR
ncbi:MAG: ADP-ribosylglycohydrolase family protein [Phycisphaerales bacterium]